MLNARYSLNILLSGLVYHQNVLKTFYKINLVLEHMHLDFLMFLHTPACSVRSWNHRSRCTCQNEIVANSKLKQTEIHCIVHTYSDYFN